LQGTEERGMKEEEEKDDRDGGGRWRTGTGTDGEMGKDKEDISENGERGQEAKRSRGDGERVNGEAGAGETGERNQRKVNLLRPLGGREIDEYGNVGVREHERGRELFGNKLDLGPKVLGSARMGQTQAMKRVAKSRRVGRDEERMSYLCVGFCVLYLG
jgi:hypothetical protein